MGGVNNLYVVTMVEVPLDGSPAELTPPEGYPTLMDWRASTYPEWRGNEEEGRFIQEPCVLVRWGRKYVNT